MKAKINALIMAGVLAINMLTPALAFSDTVSLPTIEGGERYEDVEIEVAIDTDGNITASTKEGGTTTSSGLTVEYQGDIAGDESSSDETWSATDNNGYNAEGGAVSNNSEREYADGDELTASIVEGDNSIVVSDNTEGDYTSTGTTPNDDLANYDYTETVVKNSRTLTIDNVEYEIIYNEEHGFYEDADGNQFSYNEDEDLWYWVNIWDVDWNPLYYQEAPHNMSNEMAIEYLKTNYPEVYERYTSNGIAIGCLGNLLLEIETGDTVKDEDGNVIIVTDGGVAMDNEVYKNWRTGTVSFTIVYTDDNGDLKTKTTRQGVCMRVVGDESLANEDVWFNYNNITQIGGLYCLDVSTGIKNKEAYHIVSVEDAAADGYYTEEEAATLRAILTYGYDWGINDDDGDDPHGTQAVNELTQAITDAYYANPSEVADLFNQYGVKIEDFAGRLVFNSSGNYSMGISRKDAATATGMAIWTIGNRFKEIYGDDCTVNYTSGDALTDAICAWLLTQSIDADEDTSTEVISSDVFIDDLKLTVYDKVEDNIFNQDDDDTNDVYNASFQFAMVVTPGEDDSLIVSVLDGDGNTVKTVRIAGENSENESYETITPDSDGYYTIDGLELQEGYCNYSLKLDGAQYLEQGVYVFQSANDGHASQNFIGNYEGYAEVEAELNISFEFKVDEAVVNTYHEWRRETREEKPTPTPTPGTSTPEPPTTENPPSEEPNIPEASTPEDSNTSTTPGTGVKDDIPKTGVILTHKMMLGMFVLAVLAALILAKFAKKIIIAILAILALFLFFSPEPKEDYSEAKEEFHASETAVAAEETAVSHPDIAGWLTIPAIDVDLPVMWTPDDYDTYLKKDLDGDYSEHGELFFNAETDLSDRHLIIYGHHMRDGSYFGSLKNYLDEEFFEANPNFDLTGHTYEIIAVVLDEVHNTDSEAFKYYYYLGNDYDIEFAEWLNEKAVHSRNLGSLNEDDNIVQLITCNYHTKDGRLIIVAKEVY